MPTHRFLTVRSFSQLICFLGLVLGGSVAWAQSAVSDPLAEGLQPFWRVLGGQQQFKVHGEIQASIDGRGQNLTVDLVRYDKEAFDLTVLHADYAISLRRRAESTAFALPKHGVTFLGAGKIDSRDNLAPEGIVARLVSPRTNVSLYTPLLQQVDPRVVSAMLTGLLQAKRDAQTGRWNVGDNVSFEFSQLGSLSLQIDENQVHLRVSDDTTSPPPVDSWPDMRVVELDRRELERQLARGVRRAFEILAPSQVLTDPQQKSRRALHGELRWIDGQRVVLLEGSPEEVGKAHGQLLHDEAMACVDSVLNTFGTAQTVRTGRWFRHDLEQAYARLKPHIPPRHLAETRALAQSLELDERTVEAVNVFPEMFHCSGFALFGKATRDGKLYHGRVLDYMTAIGLQDAATTFIVSVEGQIPFANVGYAGFIGSVSGMNAQAVSLGEMGGGGEGRWDGVPMATLMRRALEECDTLDKVMQLWKTSPRTCEYYFVFADGKTSQAVGVAAVPESVEFIFPGQTHARLGDGIEDTVLLSAGDRLQTLRERVQSRYGQFDAELGKWLMSRPVAMTSNLHNVLFVPEDGVLYVANANHGQIAAERPYARLDLKALLAEMPNRQAQAALPALHGSE